MIRTLMPKDFKPGDYFDVPGSETWLKVKHVNVFADESVAVWTTDIDGETDVCPFSKDEGPYIVRRPEGF